jgi:indole-3-glycerol phosphate synthase
LNSPQLSNILDHILTNTKQLLDIGYYDIPSEGKNLTRFGELPSDFLILGEIKLGSPTRGRMLRPEQVLRQIENIVPYVDGISVITEPNFFFGNLGLLKKVSKYNKPVLMKDFIVDQRQFILRREISAILLISRILSDEQIYNIIEVARQCNLEIVLEVDNERDFAKYLDIETDFLAINNRNLGTMGVDVNKAGRLLDEFQPNRKILALSGYVTYEQILELKQRGGFGVLLGTVLSLSSNPRIYLENLREKVRHSNHKFLLDSRLPHFLP